MGLKEVICEIVVLGDLVDTFFDVGYGGNEKSLWPGYKKNKLDNPISCTPPSVVKKMIKESTSDTEERFKLFCYTPQLTDRKEEANIYNTTICAFCGH